MTYYIVEHCTGNNSSIYGYLYVLQDNAEKTIAKMKKLKFVKSRETVGTTLLTIREVVMDSIPHSFSVVSNLFFNIVF